MSDYIPEDIQLKILKHLPVLTLIRSRCVCKWWKQVIDSQSFIQDHLATQKPYLLLEYNTPDYLVIDPCELPSFDIFPCPTPERLRLLGTLHGVICLYDENWYKIVLWNPWIRKLTRVVRSCPSFNWDDYDEYQFSRGPSSGFWIDPLTKEFKVIMFQLSEPDWDPDWDEELEEDDNCKMYSSARGDWKKIPMNEQLEYFYTKESTPAVVIGDVGHWTVYYDYRDDEGQENVGVVVLLFDFKQEVFLEPIGALYIKKGWNLPVLCCRNGALSLVYMDPENSYDVFSLREDGEWGLVHGFFIFPVLEEFMWQDEDADDKVRKSRVLAAITGGLLSFEPEEMILCAPLMMKLVKANEIVVASSFVPSLLFPAVGC